MSKEYINLLNELKIYILAVLTSFSHDTLVVPWN